MLPYCNWICEIVERLQNDESMTNKWLSSLLTLTILRSILLRASTNICAAHKRTFGYADKDQSASAVYSIRTANAGCLYHNNSCQAIPKDEHEAKSQNNICRKRTASSLLVHTIKINLIFHHLPLNAINEAILDLLLPMKRKFISGAFDFFSGRRIICNICESVASRL